MPANYVLLERIELQQSASSITFQNIPQSGYTDLKIIASPRTNRASDGDYIYLSFNGAQADSGKYLKGYATSAESGTVSDNYLAIPSTNNTANTFGNIEIYVPNYLSTTAKTISANVGFSNASLSASAESLGAFVWSSGSASTGGITSITLAGRFGSFVANSTFAVYGLAAIGSTPVLAAKAQGGDTIISDGTYWYHVFLNSGTFYPQQALTCNYLVVAGGGGGGSAPYDGSGGGGAGGLRSTVTATGGGGSLESAISVGSQSYTITVGAGGAGGYGAASIANLGSQGSNSVFSTITSTGGGYGAANTAGGGVSITGGNGGSGGGSHGTTSSSTGGTGTTNQGYNGGGTTSNGPWGAGGGGGGTGAAGSSGTAGNVSPNAVGGAGGAGVAISALATPTSTGVSGYYAGGGGGSTGYGSQGAAGSGGAGAGTNSAQYGNSATANTGSGGGGTGYQGYPGYGGNGGSGIVIIRYPV